MVRSNKNGYLIQYAFKEMRGHLNGLFPWEWTFMDFMLVEGQLCLQSHESVSLPVPLPIVSAEGCSKLGVC